jgi:lipopolysaccharide export system protein LptA
LDLIENKQYSFKSILNSILILIFFSINLQSQEKNIEIKSAGSFDRNESLFPDGNILGESQTKKVHLRHDEMDIFSKKSIFFQKRNSFIATGKVHVKQGDSINLFCDSLNYDGISRKFSSYGSVRFINDEMELNSSVLFFDRNINEIFFNKKGRIIDSLSTIESKKGKYLIDQKKYEFEDNVVINNPNYKIRSDMMDYYLDTELAYFFKQSTIKTENYNIFCNKGLYDTKNKIGIFKNEAKITNEERIIYGDSIYFDDNLEYASASKNIRIIDKKENLIIKGDYAEIFEKLDSALITKNPVAINITKSDSLFIKADTLFSIGKENNRKVIGYDNVKFIKGSMSGKSDKIEIDKSLGLTTLKRKKLTKRQIQILTENQINKLNPIIWDGNSQISGDEIILKENLEKNVIDSLKISNNSFIVEIDTISSGNNYNQMKGIKLYGKIIDNKLERIKIDKNAEIIYYMYDENQQLIGIDKAIASSILISFKEQGIDDIIFFNQPEGVLYPEDELEENQKTLNGFIDRFNERITNIENFK